MILVDNFEDWNMHLSSSHVKSQLTTSPTYLQFQIDETIIKYGL
jgi:hypothetical protein